MFFAAVFVILAVVVVVVDVVVVVVFFDAAVIVIVATITYYRGRDGTSRKTRGSVFAAVQSRSFEIEAITMRSGEEAPSTLPLFCCRKRAVTSMRAHTAF